VGGDINAVCAVSIHSPIELTELPDAMFLVEYSDSGK